MVNKNFLKKLDVLYVEDDVNASKKFTQILNKIFANVYTGLNGKIGFELYQNNHVDLVISDINMPIMDGLSLAKLIRTENKDIPIIFTTARTETDCLIEAIELNINSYVLKPISIDVLIDKLYKVCENIEVKETKNLLGQYKNAVDKNLIVKKFDINGKITYINEQYTLISDYTKEESLGNYFNFDSIKNNDSKIFSEIWETIENKKTWEGKLKINTKNAQEFIVSIAISPILDINNNIIEYISLSKDITDIEILNSTLSNELDDYKGDLNSKAHLLNEYKDVVNITNLLVKMNKDFKIKDVNKKFLELSDYKRNDLYDKDISFILNELEEEEVFTIIQSLVSNTDINKVVKFKTNEGEKFVDFNFTTIKNQFGEVIEYIALGNDISETINLYHEIETTQKDVIFALGSIGETRSNETANHVKRVAEYSYLLAKKLGLDEKEAQLLRIASPMHDIGKVGIPDSILKKPGKLNEEEYEIMKTHATIGYEMLKNSNREILKAAAIVSHEHHEKFDGSGYPRSLKGEDIHIYGRITAIVDVFDALGSDRCYKKAWPLEDVLKFLKKESGRHFDPKLVTLLLKNLDEILLVKDRYQDRF